MRKPQALAGAAAMLMVTGIALGAALAQDKDKIVAERQELMKQQGRDLVVVRNFFQGKADQQAALDALAKVEKSVPTVPNFFPPGTGIGEVSAKTRAKPEIWKEHDKFLAADKKVEQQLQTLAAAVKTGDKQKVEAVYKEVDFCDGCHDTFRAPQR